MTAADEAYDLIRASILDGSFKAGARLKEQEMAAYTGLSRTPIRQALQRLHNEGWVSASSNKGAFVRSFDQRDISEAYAVRLQLEPYAAEQAAALISVEQLEILGDLNDEMERVLSKESVRVEELEFINEKFHRTIILAADNSRLEACLRSIIEAPVIFRIYSNFTSENRLRSLRHHREIAAALQSRDGAWARGIMMSHICAGRNSLEPPDLLLNRGALLTR